MDSGKVLLLGGLAVGGYLVYRWYYGAGGYADQSICTASGVPMTSAQATALAVQVWQAANAENMTALDYISTGAALNTELRQNQQLAACARVAVSQYPSLALAEAALPSGASPSPTPLAPAAPVNTVSVAPGITASTLASTPAPPAPSVFNSLDAVYSALQAAASSAGINTSTGVGPNNQAIDSNGWNYYLAQVWASGGTYSLPKGGQLPGGLFPGTDGQPMTLATYWATMAPWLSSNQGLAGLGLFGALAGLASRNRRAA